MTNGSEAAAGPEPSAALIAEQLEVERNAKTSLEQRALGALASSGVIGSLSGVAVRGADLPCVARTLLVIALVGFAAAALLAVWVAHPAHYREVEHEGLAGLLKPDAWEADYRTNLRDATQVRLEIVDTFRDRNTDKAKQLGWSLDALAFGIVFLLAAVVVALVVGAP